MSNISAKMLGIPADKKSITLSVIIDGKPNAAWLQKNGKIFPPNLDTHRAAIIQSLNEDPRFKKIRMQLLFENFHHEDPMLEL